MLRHLLTVILLLITATSFSQTEAILLKQADSLFKSKKINESIVIYSKIIAKNPKHEMARRGRGYAYIELNKMEQATLDYNEALKINPGCVNCLVHLGEVALSKKDLPGAYSLAEKALTIKPDYYAPYMLKARVNEYEEKYGEAEANYTRAVMLGDTILESHYFRGEFFGHRQEFDKATKDFSTALKLDSTFALAYFRRGIIAAMNQKWNEALPDFLHAVKYDSLNSDYHSAAGDVYLYIPDPVNAHRFYTKAIQLNDKNYNAWYFRSTASYRIEDMDASCADLQAMVSRIPVATENEQWQEMRLKAINDMNDYCDSTTPGYFYQRGVANYNLKQFDKAILFYNRGLTKFPGHFMMTDFRGNAHFALHQYTEAEKDYTQSLALKNNFAGEVKQTTAYRDAGAADLQTYTAQAVAEVYHYRAEARLNLGNYAGAMEDIDEAIALFPANIPGKEAVFAIKGDICLAKEENSNALSWYNKALQLSPDYIPALANRALAKLNLAYKVRVVQRYAGIQGARINLPTQTQTVVNTATLEAALADCNKAIATDPGYAYVYYVRSMIKEALKQPDYCYDLFKAEKLGLDFVKELILEKKCR
ncbi:MAG TPA: tetratricopeptide repeat protein [Chitinophagaceae bacterium]|jgi:tetratricopeptide (TPR) repeat protein|nr:tetratricopeptide repeat protein [Chitinophagaceae bacterium]